MKLDVYGCNISYYTGKLEAYLRYRSIPYQSLPTVGNEKKLLAGAGVVQMPVVQIDDGRWMTDDPIRSIDHFRASAIFRF